MLCESLLRNEEERRSSMTCGSHRNPPKQTGAPDFPCHREGPRHFRSYAYNPVFKDRAELKNPDGLFSTRVLQLRKLAPCGALLRSAGGGGNLRFRLPSVNLFLDFVTVANFATVDRAGQGEACVPAPRLPQPPSSVAPTGRRRLSASSQNPR
jgi:hypothetical protein